MPENYIEIESRIKAACEKLCQLQKPNVAAMAHEFGVSEGR
jgi:hypothetical protein